jgi:hypothetical protein
MILILLRTQRIISTTTATALLGLLLLFDLASFDLSLIHFISRDEALAPGRPAADYLAQRPGLFRTYSPSYSLPMQTAAATDLQLADGVEPVHLAIYDQFMARAGGYGDSSFSVTIPNFGEGPLESALEETKPNLKLLGLLNVQYLTSAFPMAWPGLNLETEIDGTYIYRNELSLPRAWVAHHTIPAEPDWLAQLERLTDLSNTVVIEDGPMISGATSTATAATITYYSANLVEVETVIPKPGWLVLSEIWYPGWQATAHGNSPQPLPVERVNGLLRGVYLEQPGEYQLSLEYRSERVILGGWISGLTVAALILVGLVVVVRKTAVTT